MNGLLTDRQHSLFANRKLFDSILSKTLMQSTRTVQALDTPTRPEQRKRPEHPYRPEQLKRPESGRSDTGQSNSTVQILDALLGSNCVVC